VDAKSAKRARKLATCGKTEVQRHEQVAAAGARDEARWQAQAGGGWLAIRVLEDSLGRRTMQCDGGEHT